MLPIHMLQNGYKLQELVLSFSWWLDSIQPSWCDLSVMLKWLYWSWKLNKSLGMTTKDHICSKTVRHTQHQWFCWNNVLVLKI